MILVKETDNTGGTMIKVDLFKELERLGLPSWTWNTNLPSRVSSTEIADTPSSTPKEEIIKEARKDSPQVPEAVMKTKSVSSNVKHTTRIVDTAWKLIEECEYLSCDNSTAASTQQTTSMSSNKWREPPIYSSSVSIQGDREKLAQCIVALRLWVKVSGVK